uniref:Uncharacterized protein n=1 Tax=Panagrolaimus sp. JU765 TaxID=591449 RepID=A0AC34R7Z2_9BILA
MEKKNLFFQFNSTFVHCSLGTQPLFYDQVIAEEVDQHVDPSILPTAKFQNLDDLLKRQLYQRCFPVIRRKLWLSSTETSDLGEKPKTYGTTAAIFKEIEECSQKLSDENVVIILFNSEGHHFDVKFEEIHHLNLNCLKQIFEFQMANFYFENSTVSNQQLDNFLPRHASYFAVKNSNIDFQHILDILPNLKFFVYDSPLPDDWEKILFKSKQKFDKILIKQGKLKDVKSLYNFIQNRPLHINFLFHIEEMAVDKKELFKYFKKCDCRHTIQKCIVIDSPWLILCCKKTSDVKREKYLHF